MTKSTFGSLLNAYRFAKEQALRKAQQDIFKRNKITFADSTNGYKIVQDKRIKSNGTESIAVTLWKKIDEVVISVTGDIKTTTEDSGAETTRP